MKAVAGIAAALLNLVHSVNAQSSTWGQCGGIGWTGATTCTSGNTCTVINAYYYQCLPGTTTGATTVTSTTTTSKTTSTSTTSTTTSAPKTTSTTTSSQASTTSTVTSSGGSASGGYVQKTSGVASFTHYSGCGSPACGKAASGFTAAISQLAFGSAPGLGAGDACGRCFALEGSSDPYSPAFAGPFYTVVVKVTDLCPVAGNVEWCGQTVSNPVNEHGAPVHFDLCEDTGASAAFFPSGHGALTGTYTEVSCSQWSGTDGSILWNGGCLDGETASNWPSTGCGNKGTAPA